MPITLKHNVTNRPPNLNNIHVDSHRKTYVNDVGVILSSEPWTMHWSRTNQRKYFYNANTRESRFDCPPVSISSFRYVHSFWCLAHHVNNVVVLDTKSVSSYSVVFLHALLRLGKWKLLLEPCREYHFKSTGHLGNCNLNSHTSSGKNLAQHSWINASLQ